MSDQKVRRLVISSVMMALGLVLPLLTGQIRQIGNMLQPMHLPVLICGLVCGWQWGMAVGAALPILRSLLFSMPVLMPNAICMSFELAAYGFFSGFLYRRLAPKPSRIFVTLAITLLLGRLVWGVSSWAVYSLFTEKTFSLALFWTNGFATAWPGMLLQMTVIPVLMSVLHKNGFITR